MKSRAESDADHPRSRWSVWAVGVRDGDFARDGIARHTGATVGDCAALESGSGDFDISDRSAEQYRSLNWESTAKRLPITTEQDRSPPISILINFPFRAVIVAPGSMVIAPGLIAGQRRRVNPLSYKGFNVHYDRL